MKTTGAVNLLSVVVLLACGAGEALAAPGDSCASPGGQLDGTLCGAGEDCETSTRTCVADGTAACTSDADCYWSDHYCDVTAGVCTVDLNGKAVGEPCLSGCDCMGNELCDGTTGRCVAAGSIGGACTRDADCPAGEICDDGADVCVPPDLACGRVIDSCLTDADCLPGFACDTDAQQCHGARCSSDSQCLSGESCQSGQCAPGGCSVASARDARPEPDGLVQLMVLAGLLVTIRRRRATLARLASARTRPPG
jgi:MYXO-CTERM domain-containing protein